MMKIIYRFESFGHTRKTKGLSKYFHVIKFSPKTDSLNGMVQIFKKCII